MRLCKVSRCGRRHLARGFCSMHWQRWHRSGGLCDGSAMEAPPRRLLADPTNRGTAQRFLSRATHYTGTDCLLWPYGTNQSGYGQIYYRRRLYRAHNLVCRLVHGDPPSLAHVAAHACGNKLCVTPQHLRWATREENSADTRLHGRHHTKLLAADVLAILAQPQRSVRGLAKEYAVTNRTIELIRSRVTWAWLGGN